MSSRPRASSISSRTRPTRQDQGRALVRLRHSLRPFPMTMVAGDYTSKVTAPCSAQLSAIFVCVFSEKDLMMGAKTMLVQELESGFLIMMVSHTCPLGERLGFRYLVCLIGLEATLCPQSFGFFLHFFLCIQLCRYFSRREEQT
ncbi:uncharacterized protein LOC133717678 [Rosa rugosa]|uniref:uncharacterized protein LOC133717678 n=1 Tax=Rosa rugosa TaxID=74645 RepID=UPI002B40BB37|nr:uncharacterized protein LOC133717678 [Rosa rugosa]